MIAANRYRRRTSDLLQRVFRGTELRGEVLDQVERLRMNWERIPGVTATWLPLSILHAASALLQCKLPPATAAERQRPLPFDRRTNSSGSEIRGTLRETRRALRE